MSPRSVLAGGAVAIALLSAVAVVILWRAERWGGTRSGAAPSGPERAPSEPAPATAAAPTWPAVGMAPGAVVPASAPREPLPDVVPARPNRPASAAAHVEWESVPMVARVGQLGRDVSGPVARGLQAARAQMDGCFAEEAARLARGDGPRFDPADPPTGPATLLLLLQSRPGGVDVVDTQVVALGTSTAQLTSCVRHVLKGWPIQAPGANGGRRYRLRYVVQ